MMPFNFRYLEPDTDLPRLVRLYAAAQAADGEGQDVIDARLREQMSFSGPGPVQDCWVVESSEQPNELVAVASVRKGAPGDRVEVTGVVHPDWRRKGIGRILIGRVLVRARTIGATHAGATAEAHNQPGNAFLREHGFLPVAAYTLLRAPGGLAFAAPTWPAGFSVRSFDAVLDVSVLAQAMTSSYDGLWGHNAVTETDVGAWLREWDPNGVFLVFDAGGEVAGMCRAEISQRLSQLHGERTGYIDAPGVIPWRRRQDLYLPLLLTAVHYLKARQPVNIEMESWGDDDRTLDVFQQAGFEIARRSVSYRLNLR